MTAQELSNMVFAIKNKITDKEFKDIMEKLSVKNEEEDCFYEFSYIEQTPIVEGKDDEDVDKHYTLKTIFRKKIIRKIVIEHNVIELKDFIQNPAYYSYMMICFDYTDETILRISSHFDNSPSNFNNDYVMICDNCDGLWIQYQDIFPISLKKI